MPAEKRESALCDITIIHEDILRQVKKEMTDDESLFHMAETFKALSDPTRLKIINALLLSEMCVCDLAAPFKHVATGNLPSPENIEANPVDQVQA